VGTIVTLPTESPQIDYYKLLGIPYSATGPQITRAYRDAMKRSHPDTVGEGQRAAAEEHAKLLNLALKTLTKPHERRAYDATLRREMVQDQIMSQYFGGMGMPGGQSHDPFAEALRREQTEREKDEKRRTDRSALSSVLLVFGGATALVVCSLVLWAVVSALVRALL
jgi:DnaJ-class molecular chaperone